MKKYTITLQDIFSFSTFKKTAEISKDQLNQMYQDIESKRIVLSRLENGIKYNWIIKEIN